MISLEELYRRTEEHYFSSHEFNGLAIYNIEGCTLANARPLIRDGVVQDVFQLERSGIPHILRNLSAQGLFRELRDSRPWESRFTPVCTEKAGVVDLLLSHPSVL